MNGSEMTRQEPQPDPRLVYSAPTELTDYEKMDLMAGDGSPYARAIDKLMKLEIVKARNEAMDADPANDAIQRTKMTIAHAMNKFYESLRGQIEFEKVTHLSDVRQKIAEEDLKDQAKIEEIVMAQTTR